MSWAYYVRLKRLFGDELSSLSVRSAADEEKESCYKPDTWRSWLSKLSSSWSLKWWWSTISSPTSDGKKLFLLTLFSWEGGGAVVHLLSPVASARWWNTCLIFPRSRVQVQLLPLVPWERKWQTNQNCVPFLQQPIYVLYITKAKQAGGQVCWQTDRLTDWWTYRLSDWQTDGLTDLQTDRLIEI
jgi:hypothetical protein